MGGAGVFSFPWQEHFMLENNEWKYDKVPEILNGTNITDYVDPEIEEKIKALEEEQAKLHIPDAHVLDQDEREELDALN